MERSQERLREDGFTDDEIARVFEAVPVATHNQRGIGTLHIGCPEGCTDALEAETLLEIVESAMSSEIYELMKRSDEVEVVEKAHLRPRFVEDCVREMVRMATERFAGLGDDAFVSARQENLETIHKHNVVAERHGMMGELVRRSSRACGPRATSRSETGSKQARRACFSDNVRASSVRPGWVSQLTGVGIPADEEPAQPPLQARRLS